LSRRSGCEQIERGETKNERKAKKSAHNCEEQTTKLPPNAPDASATLSIWRDSAALCSCHGALFGNPLLSGYMSTAFGSDITINVIASVIASLILLGAGFLWGKYKERRKFGRNLEEYDFYPFDIDRDNVPRFNLKDFRLGVHYFLKNNDYTAARQLIFIGEQNNVREKLEPAEQKVYAKLFEKYEGKKIADDTTEFGQLRAPCPLDRQIVSEYWDRDFAPQSGGSIAFAHRPGEQCDRPAFARWHDQPVDRFKEAAASP
jgi:hypothetical protein